MVGNLRLNNHRRRGGRERREAAPFCDRTDPVGVLSHEAFSHDALSQDAPNHDAPSHERSAVNSIGRRSDCQSKKIPPTRNTKSASQTPAAGESFPCRAKETPIRETE